MQRKESHAPQNLPAKPIVLIGLMGAGKSTVGRRLAKEIGWDFADSDHEIEASAGCSVSDIFALHGESLFRDLEQRVITRLISGPPLVLATGGGAWMQPDLRALIQERAISVWLRADLEILLERVSRRSHRPLLEQGDKRAILSKLLAEREPVYAQADLTILSDSGEQETVVRRILDALDHFTPRGAA
jgi:shikimate kinase